MNIVLFTHSSPSHITSIKNFVKALSNTENNIYIFVDKHYVGDLGDKVYYKIYPDKIDKKNSQILSSPYHLRLYQGDFLNNTENDLIERIIGPFKYVIEGAMNYIEAIENDVLTINPDLIIRDSCALFGRYFSEKLNVPLIGYTSSPCVTEKYTIENFSEVLSVNNRLDTKIIEGKELEFIKKVTKHMVEISKKIAKKPFSFQYLTDPDDDFNFTFGSPNLNFYSEKDDYTFVKPSIFERQDVIPVKSHRDKILVASGNLIVFPLIFYNYLINAVKYLDISTFISLKYASIHELSINKLPENVQIVERVKQKDYLPECYAFISHGGFNSVLESIFYEVPLLIYPQSSDQFIISERIQELKLGYAIEETEVSTSYLREKLELICNKKNTDYCEKVRNEKKNIRELCLDSSEVVEKILQIRR
jgi:MGT family glycosyltransferase